MLETTWAILCDTAIYILLGFLVAGFLQAWMSGGRATQWLSRRRPRSVILATLVGAPLPLCSCSVLPAAVTLRRSGASRGATLSFLISTPETSATSIFLTYSLLGPLLALVRPIAAVITALTAGFIENFFDRRDATEDAADAPKASEEGEEPAASCCSGDAGLDEKNEQRKSVAEGLNFAFVELFDSIFHWILIGIITAAAIQAFLPAGVIADFVSNPLLAMLLMLVISIPLYICAEASTPIAAALIAQGLNPGAALVLLLAGPATNVGAVGVLHRELGRRTVVVYLVTIAVVSLLMGWSLNLMLGAETVPLTVRTFDEPLLPGWLKTLGAVTFLTQGLYTIRRNRWGQRILEQLDRRLPFRVSATGALVALAVGAVIGYACSGFFTVQPGEAGIVKRFGRIVRTDLAPGLYYAWPYPVETADRIPVKRVNRLTLGYSATPPDSEEATMSGAESWALLGDENIADIKGVLHWGARPGQTLLYAYAVRDKESLVRSAALTAMREVLGGRTINRGFTTERRDCEEMIEALTRRCLEAYKSGIRVDSFCFLDAHAPADVHDSFRDVASALEDKSTQINIARARRETILPQARGEAERLQAEAEGYAAITTALAVGEARRFTDLLEGYYAQPRVMRWRLYIETLERILPGMRTYIKPGGADSDELEIWLVDPRLRGGLPWQGGADLR